MYLLPPETIRPNTVHVMDAISLLRALPSGSVDCIVTDPPYGVNKAEWDTKFPTDWISEVWRVTCRMVVMCGTDDIINVASSVGKYTGCIVLHARNGMTRTHIGFRNWTPALLFGDWKWRPAPDYIPFNVAIAEHIPHPSPKPFNAMMKLLQYYTDPDWLIIDPFAGSGTTLVAAQRLGRQYIGCDISAEYISIARRRLSMPYTLPMFQEAG